VDDGSRNLTDELRASIRYNFYQTGHMMNVHEEELMDLERKRRAVHRDGRGRLGGAAAGVRS